MGMWIALLLSQQVPGQVGYWTFENNYNDSSGQGNAGTPQGGPAFSPLVPPGLTFANAGSLQVDGVDDWVDLGNPAVFPAGTSPRSLSAWARATSVAAGYAWAVAYGSPATGQAFFLGRNAATYFGGGYGDDITSANFWTVDTWRHLALTYDGTTARLYADGTELLNLPKTWNLTRSLARIGRQANAANEFWTGQIDEVRIYSRVITATEVAILAGGNPVPQNLQSQAGVQIATLTWAAPADAAAQTQPYAYLYNIYRSTNGGAFALLVGGVSGLTYTDETATSAAGTTDYTYRITAVSAAESGPSNLTTARPTLPLPRTDDHSEGLLDESCSCGSTISTPWAALAGLAILGWAWGRMPRWPSSRSR